MSSRTTHNKKIAAGSDVAPPISHLLASLHDHGYALNQQPHGVINAVYLPARNQIWLNHDPSLRRRMLVLAHECFHVDAAFLQPAMLHPLRNHLLDAKDRPTTKEFEDIVESLVAVVLPVLSGRRPIRGSISTTHVDYRVVAEQYLDLAKSLARRARKSVRKPTVQALRAINYLLMHVRPYTPNNAPYLVQLLRRRHLVDRWSNHWELFFKLHHLLQATHQGSPRAQSRFMLAPPLDPHRCVGDMLIFLSGALLAGRDHPDRLTKAIPSLMGILSMGCLFIVPIVNVSYSTNRFRLRIGVVHSTTRGTKLVRQIIEHQRSIGDAQQSTGLHCPITPLFADIFEIAKVFRDSRSRTRLSDCSKALLELLPQRVHQITRKRYACPGCELVLRNSYVAASGDHVAAMHRSDREVFLAAAEGYEHWLLTECAHEFIRGAPVRIERAYRYL